MKNINIFHTGTTMFCICMMLVALVMFPAKIVNAQCGLTAGTGGSTTVTAGTYTGTINWSGWTKITGNIIVDGSGDLIIAAGANIEISPSKTITIESGGTLTINSGAELYSLSAVWGGIIIEGGGDATITSAGIFNAVTGIYLDNVGAESLLDVTGSIFCNNKTGIKIDAYSGAMTTVISNNDFTAPAIFTPPGGVGDYGIRILDVENGGSSAILIGNNSVHTSGTANNFYDLEVGIKTERSDVSIQNNSFTHMLATEKTGVYAIASSTNNGFLEVGVISPSSSPNNLFTDCELAVHSKNYVKTKVHYNTIAGVATSPGYTMNDGVFVENTIGTNEVVGNTIKDFNGRGVYFDELNTNATVRVGINSIFYTTSLASTDVPEGVRIEDAGTPFGSYSIDDNQIEDMKTGILCLDLIATTKTIVGNEIDFEYPGTPDRAYGIHIVGCTSPYIAENRATGTCTAGGSCSNKVIPLWIEGTQGAEVTENSFETGNKYGMVWTRSVLDGNMYCNEITDCDEGVGLLNIGDISPVPIGLYPGVGTLYYIERPSTNEAADDRWFGSFTYKIVAIQSGTGDCLCDNVRWRYQNSPTEFNITGGDIDLIGSAVAPTPLISTDNDDDCYSPFLRETGEYDALLAPYFDWADNYPEDGEDMDEANNYYRAWMLWQIVKENPDVQEEFNDLLSDAYSAVEISNIPAFDEIHTAIANGDFDEATELNDVITPVNTIEENWQLANDYYLAGLDEDGYYTLNEEYRDELEGLAQLPGKDNGFGVYMAMNMLGKVYAGELPEEEKLAKVIENMNVSLNPNPTEGIFTIGGNLSENDYFDIEVTDVIGKILFLQYNVNNKIAIDVSYLEQGVYIVRGKQQNCITFISKLVVQ